jgi:hypothetical protein
MAQATAPVLDSTTPAREPEADPVQVGRSGAGSAGKARQPPLSGVGGHSGVGGRRSARCRSAAGHDAARFGCTGLSACGVAVVIGTMVLLEAGVASGARPGAALEAGPEGGPVPGGGLGDDQGDAAGVEEDAAADTEHALAEAA